VRIWEAFRGPRFSGRVGQHGLGEGVVWWGFTLEVPYRKLPVVARKLAGFAGAWAVERGCQVGWVGIFPDEPPKLLAFAPKADLVAQHFLMATVENPGHLLPQLWLALPRNTYLATVVDPYVPFVLRQDQLVSQVAGGEVTEALYLEPRFARRLFQLSGFWVLPRGRRGALFAQLRQLLAPGSF